MGIKTVGIIGLGALGIMYGKFLTDRLEKDSVFFIANKQRIDRYRLEGVYLNNERCDFSYLDSDEKVKKLDLLIFTVKFNSLIEAVNEVKNFIHEGTIILSFLNGITSEEIIGQILGHDKVLYSTVQGMDCVKVGNRVTYINMGNLVFGERDNIISNKVEALGNFLNKVGFSYEVPVDMMSRMWGKLMLNTGVNQSVAVFETNYGGVQRDGKPRDIMIGAMKEVLEVSKKENINLRENEIEIWLKLLASIDPNGKPSLRQDTEAHRKTEVELFSGTIIKLGKKHGIVTPYNDFLYKEIRAMEDNWEKIAD